jgi:6-pyruvoyltetrahydropterin/6-carboxytetrahydropterin synthase
MKVAKEYKWEMGHRLQFHDGKCKNLHGHSYKAIFEFEGDADENGMVIDFYNVDKIVNPIIDELDHSFICHRSDTELSDLLSKLKSKIVFIDYPSTAENISMYLCDKVANSNLPKNINTITVRVSETIDSFAERTVKFN